MKVKAELYEVFEGSDDPRAIQGGGGAGMQLIETRTNSAHLIAAYVRAYYNRYGDRLKTRIVAYV